MDKQIFSLSSDGKSDKCSVQEWMQSIEDGRSKDRLSEADEVIDGSVGGLKDALENVLNTNRAVPLFEFRNLAGVKAADMKDKVTKAEQAVIDYHNTLGNPPRLTRTKRSARSVVSKRQDPCGSSSPTTSPTPATTTSKSTPTCAGNQVQGSCIAGTLPSSTPYSGYIGPSCLKADGSPNSSPRLNTKTAQDAAQAYCQSLVDKKIVLADGAANPAPDILKGKAENGGQMSLTVMYFKDSCPQDKSRSELDFAALGVDVCFQNLFTALQTGCEQDSTWDNYDPDWTFEGGVFGGDCGLFSISGE